MKKCKEKSLKSRNGITLIALVITIIVLLILAGISISMLSGDNGLLTKAGDAKTQTGIGQEKEIISLAYNSALAKKISNLDSTAVTAVDLNTELTNQGASADGDNPITVTFENGHKYTIDSKGNIGEYIPPKFQADYTTGKILVEGKDIGLEIGDTIKGYDALSGATKFTEKSDTEKNGYAEQLFRLKFGTDDEEQIVSYDLSNEGPGWKALGVDSQGNLMITTTDVVRPIKIGDQSTGTLNYTLLGSSGLENSIQELDKICELYGQGNLAKNARSIREKDIINITCRDGGDIDGKGTVYAPKYWVPFGNGVTFSWEEDSGVYPYMSFLTATGTSVNRKMKTSHAKFYYYDQKTYKVVESVANSSLGNINENPLICTYYVYTKANSEGSEKAKNMIFISSYILADRYFACHYRGVGVEDYGVFGVRTVSANQVGGKSIFVTHGSISDRDAVKAGIRPVVTLESGITIEKTGDSIWKVSKIE